MSVDMKLSECPSKRVPFKFNLWLQEWHRNAPDIHSLFCKRLENKTTLHLPNKVYHFVVRMDNYAWLCQARLKFGHTCFFGNTWLLFIKIKYPESLLVTHCFIVYYFTLFTISDVVRYLSLITKCNVFRFWKWKILQNIQTIEKMQWKCHVYTLYRELYMQFTAHFIGLGCRRV